MIHELKNPKKWEIFFLIKGNYCFFDSFGVLKQIGGKGRGWDRVAFLGKLRWHLNLHECRLCSTSV